MPEIQTAPTPLDTLFSRLQTTDHDTPLAIIAGITYSELHNAILDSFSGLNIPTTAVPDTDPFVSDIIHLLHRLNIPSTARDLIPPTTIVQNMHAIKQSMDSLINRSSLYPAPITMAQHKQRIAARNIIHIALEKIAVNPKLRDSVIRSLPPLQILLDAWDRFAKHVLSQKQNPYNVLSTGTAPHWVNDKIINKILEALKRVRTEMETVVPTSETPALLQAEGSVPPPPTSPPFTDLYRDNLVVWWNSKISPWWHNTISPWWHNTISPWWHNTISPWWHNTIGPMFLSREYKAAIIILQKNYRGRLARQDAASKKAAIIILQKNYRGLSARKTYQTLKKARTSQQPHTQLGAMAIGAMAIGAMAIGAMAIQAGWIIIPMMENFTLITTVTTATTGLLLSLLLIYAIYKLYPINLTPLDNSNTSPRRTEPPLDNDIPNILPPQPQPRNSSSLEAWQKQEGKSRISATRTAGG